MGDQKHGFATRAIHDGQAPDKVTGAVNVPIYLTSTYQQEAIGKNKGHEYARLTNPTRDALEESLCSLEGGTSAHCFASGMAAITAMFTMMKTGDHVVATAKNPDRRRLATTIIIPSSNVTVSRSIAL